MDGGVGFDEDHHARHSGLLGRSERSTDQGTSQHRHADRRNERYEELVDHLGVAQGLPVLDVARAQGQVEAVGAGLVAGLLPLSVRLCRDGPILA